jgi:hypothetical protein
MEPNSNPNVSRTLRQVFYNMTRRYGEQIEIRRVIENDIDYSTGNLSRTYRRETIRNAVYIPPITERNVNYTPAMMQAIRQFAWQGSGQDVQESGFLILARDLRSWGEVDPTQRIRWREHTHEVVRAQQFDGGMIIWTKVAINSHADDSETEPSEDEGVGFWAIGSTFEVS